MIIKVKKAIFFLLEDFRNELSVENTLNFASILCTKRFKQINTSHFRINVLIFTKSWVSLKVENSFEVFSLRE